MTVSTTSPLPLVLAAAALLAGAHARSNTGEPGFCKDDKSCEENYVCISVQTTRSGIEGVKQCLPYVAEGDVCSGTFSGLCPSFSTWDTKFQSISSVCAYQLPSGTDQCLNDTFSGGSDTSGYVSCMDISAGSGSSATSVGVIFGCVDFDGSNLLFEEDSANWELSSEMNYTGVINEGCVNPTNGENSDVVCSGRGTCAPASSGSMGYACNCNIGYNGTFCQNIVSNKCTLESQCQAGTCNLVTQECECEEGTTGDQCAFCDPSSTKACNGRGKCVAAPSLTTDVNGTTNANGTMDSDTTTSAGSDMNMATVDTVDSEGSGSPTAARFLMEAVGMASLGSTSGGGNGNVCVCESGYTGDQCTREVESSGSGDDKKSGRRNPSSSDASSIATSFGVVAAAFAFAVWN
uniref:Cysteine-rich protein n=1 Tax=Hyaloperonospora arabidopsidis TaxID=272952 RepID=F6MEY8_HYAAB|nr:cysteine-rich protein [Hyaloperonospora arabidopsidis]